MEIFFPSAFIDRISASVLRIIASYVQKEQVECLRNYFCEDTYTPQGGTGISTPQGGIIKNTPHGGTKKSPVYRGLPLFIPRKATAE